MKNYENLRLWGGVDTVVKLQRRLRKYETFNEWENVEYFGEWSNRSKLMSQMIINESKSLLDLGCGEMHIRKFLAQDVIYYGCDYKKRDENTIVCDLAKGDFPDVHVDTVFMAGVLEYLGNWRDVLRKMAEHGKQILLSYSTIESAPKRSDLWVNELSEEDIISTIEGFGFSLIERKWVTENSVAYSFVKE